jgi:hypothetical protein
LERDQIIQEWININKIQRKEDEMKRRLTAKNIKQALIREPGILKLLSENDRKISQKYFIEERYVKMSQDELAKLKRNIGTALIHFIAEGKNSDISIEPKKIWKDDETMESYLQEWMDIGNVILHLKNSPNKKMRDLVVKSIFNFHSKYHDIESFITNHEFMFRGKEDL